MITDMCKGIKHNKTAKTELKLFYFKLQHALNRCAKGRKWHIHSAVRFVSEIPNVKDELHVLVSIKGKGFDRLAIVRHEYSNRIATKLSSQYSVETRNICLSSSGFVERDWSGIAEYRGKEF